MEDHKTSPSDPNPTDMPKFGMNIFDEFQNLCNDFAGLLHDKDQNDIPDFDDLKKKYQDRFKHVPPTSKAQVDQMKTDDEIDSAAEEDLIKVQELAEKIENPSKIKS